MTHLLHRQIRQHYVAATGGQGCTLVDAEGRRYLDACGGAAVSCLGHQHPRVLAAIHAQLDRLAWAHTSFFTSEPAEQLADELIAHAPEGLTHAYLVSGGSEAMEAALKMARQYFVETGQPQKRHFIARRQSYHGNTLGALAVGGNAWRRAQFAPILIDGHYIDPCNAYRYAHPGETPEAYGRRSADALEHKIHELGAENVIAFVAEPVVGATMGAVPAAPGYFRRIRDICDRHGVLLILDEVMCGMGRTGSLHACTQEGVTPDLMAIAKGLGGGYMPIGATLLSEDVFQAFAGGSGLFQHGHTYLGHPLAAAAALAVQRTVREEGLLANVQARGEQLGTALRERFARHPAVGDIRGRGLFWGVELVYDRETKAPFDPSLRVHAQVRAEALARGLMVYPMGGTIDGRSGDHVLLAPPFIVSAEETATIVERLGEAVDAATRPALALA